MQLAPVVIVLVLAAGLVVLILHDPGSLVGLALAALALCLAAIVGAVLLRSSRVGKSDTSQDAAITAALTAVVATPALESARADLRRHVQRLDDVIRISDHLDAEERAGIRSVLVELGIVRTLERQAKEGTRWEGVAAARQLAWLRPADIVPRLERIARDRRTDVALAAAIGLSTLPGAAAYIALLGLLDTGPLPASRIATLLEESAHAAPAATLNRAVPGGSTAVRFWGAYLAGRTRDPRLLPLLTSLAADPDLKVRANTAEALASLSPEMTSRTLFHLSRDEQWMVRAHAARSLGAVGEAAADRLVEMLSDTNWWVRENAATALARIGEATIPRLRDTLTSRDRFARNKAAEMLVGLGFVERELDRLGGFADEPRRSAGDSLVLLGRAEAFDSLSARFLAVADADRRADLARLCREIDDPRLRETLDELEGVVAPTAPEADSRTAQGAR